jgi:23S rRNA maturation-related 3'-5' exoribonuclease YhaM
VSLIQLNKKNCRWFKDLCIRWKPDVINLNLQKKRWNTTQSRHTFSSKIVDKLNSLSEVTVTVNSINIFKSRLNEDNLNDKKCLPT